MGNDVDRLVETVDNMTRQLLAKREEQDAVLTRIQERQNRIINRMWVICATWLAVGFILGVCSTWAFSLWNRT